VLRLLWLFNGDTTDKKHKLARLNGKGNMSTTAKQPLSITYTTKDTNVMTLKFDSDQVKHDKGFYARFDAIPVSTNDPSQTICPATSYTGPFGVIVSPKWPNMYPSESKCDYLVEVSSGEKIELTVNYFETQAQWDHVSIYDGKTTAIDKLETLSGVVEHGKKIVSSSNVMLISFLTNTEVEKQGFSFTYTEI